MKLVSLTDDLADSRLCVQCGRCSAGCPVAFESPHTPRRVLRFLQIGRMDLAARSPFLWFCATCQTCTVRCPRGVDVLGIMLALRRGVHGERRAEGGGKPSFYSHFHQMIGEKKRIREIHLGFRIALQRLPLHPLEDALLLFKLWRRGKI